MSETKVLRPADGARVRHPGGRLLAPEGEPVEMTAYWRRREAAGDAVAVASTAKAEPAKPARAASKKTTEDRTDGDQL